MIAFARERIAHFKAPRRVEIVEELPRNATGKLLKRVLRERFAGSARGGVAVTALGAAAPVSAHDAWETAERRELRAMVRRFTEREIVPHLEEWEDAGGLPRSLHRSRG